MTFRHDYTNMITLPSPLDSSSRSKLSLFIDCLHPEYSYLFFFYTYLENYCQDFKGRGDCFIYTGCFLHHYMLIPNLPHRPISPDIIFSELKSAFLEKVEEFNESDDKKILPNEIIFLKVFNIGNIKDCGEFGYEIPGGGIEELSMDWKDKIYYTADYSTPISFPKDKRITLHPFKTLLYLSDGISGS